MGLPHMATTGSTPIAPKHVPSLGRPFCHDNEYQIKAVRGIGHVGDKIVQMSTSSDVEPPSARPPWVCYRASYQLRGR